MNELVLKGIDGANPLGFLAAVGALATAESFCKNVRMGWTRELGTWRPVLSGCEPDEEDFAETLSKALSETSSEPFEFEKKLPFSSVRFGEILKEIQPKSTPENRRESDILCGFGSEAYPEDDIFQDTLLRMVRSGDAAGQGLPAYALAIRKAAGASELKRALFEIWDYADDCFSLRWDPLEDQRYAMRWHDPSKKKDEYAPKTMVGANALALEALALLPSMHSSKRLATTGFHKNDAGQFFTWPIWEPFAGREVVRSLLALGDIHRQSPLREKLQARGIVEIYRCHRIAPNQYYRNFAPSVSVF